MKYRSGIVIKQAREKMGWQQSELAQRLGGKIRQQAISGWERGISRPRRNMLPLLSEELAIDLGALSEACDYNKGEEIPLPVRPLLTILPLQDLNFDQFEQFCNDLISGLYPNQQVHRWGGQGHKQDGIDLLRRDQSENVAAYQCKKCKEFGSTDVSNAVNEVKIKAKEYVILLSRFPASPGSRKEISKNQNWDIWDAGDISKKVKDLYTSNPDNAIALVDNHFPGWRENFLGVSTPSPWISHQRFFEKFDSNEIFSQRWHLVGRENILKSAKKFLSSDDRFIAILLGLGGSGKTRLLKEISEIAERDLKYIVRLIETDQSPTLQDFEKLPKGDKLLVLIDDAQQRSNIAGLINNISSIRKRVKFILALHPYGNSQLSEDLRRIGIFSTELEQWDIGSTDLKLSEAKDLAREILSSQANEAEIDRIARLTLDCPLITVMASVLLKRGEINSFVFEGQGAIRSVLIGYQNTMINSLKGNLDPSVIRKLLNAIAAVQPLNIEDQSFRDSLSEITGLKFYDIAPYIKQFKEHGILISRQQSLRIVPDLLGDVILADACFMSPTSYTTTGYAEDLYSKLKALPLQNLIKNLVRVDWQINPDNSERALSEFVWSKIEKEFKHSSISERIQIIQFVKKISYFHPKRALGLARWAINNPTQKTREAAGVLSKIYNPTYQDVLNEIPPILKGVAYNLEFLTEAMNLLWELAKVDSRETNPFPYHPIRILQDLASYQIGKPVTFNNLVIDACAKWLEEPELSNHSPFDILDQILVTESSDDSSEGFTISFRPYPVNISAVNGLRERVNDLAFKELLSDDLARASRAAETIGHSLRYPQGLFGRVVKREERENWTPVFVTTINRLETIMKNDQLDPLVRVLILDNLSWHINYSTTSTRKAAHKVKIALPDSLEQHVALAMYDGWGHFFKRINDFEKAEQRKQDWLENIATELIKQKSDQGIIKIIEERLSKQFKIKGRSANPLPFIWTLVKARPSIGMAICERIKTEHNSALVEVLSIVLAELIKHDASSTIILSNTFLKLKNIKLARMVAQAFGWNRGNRTSLVKNELKLLSDLSISNDQSVRINMIRAAQIIAKDDRVTAINLLSLLKFQDSAAIAEEYFSVFYSPGFPSWISLPSKQLDLIWDQLVLCPSLDDYHISKFLSEASEVCPGKVLKLLKVRVEKDEKQHNRDEYKALPYDWQHQLKFRNDPNFLSILSEIRNWIAQKTDSWQRAMMGAKIFTGVAIEFDHNTIKILEEGIFSGTKEQLDAVISILREAPREFVWDHVDFVRTLLDQSAKYGDSTLKRASGALYNSVISGVRTGIPGQPFAEDIAQRDRSIKTLESLKPGSREAIFFKSLAESAIQNIKSRAEEDEKLRDWRDW